MTTVSVKTKREIFRDLHRQGCFVLPNPWDGRSATLMAKADFKALASTSAGAAWALGVEDGEMTLEQVLAHLRFLGELTDLPINADFEAGFADTADGVGAHVALCVETGVAGLSIEDRDGQRLFPVEVAVERLKAARGAIDRAGGEVILVGRCEAYLMDPLDLDAVIARLRAYGEAGADCLYAPGLRELESHARLVQALDKPVNANLTGTGLSQAQLAEVGVRRISVGAALAKATYDRLGEFIAQLATEGRLP